MFRIPYRAIASALSLALCTHGQESIRGTFTLKLSSPVTAEISAKARAGARANLRTSLLEWLETNRSFQWDTTNAIHRIHLDTLAGLCICGQTETSRFDGPRWSIIYSIPADKAATAVARHNARCDSLALRAYADFEEAARGHQMARMYVMGISTIFHAEGHVGRALRDPEDPTKSIVEQTRLALGPLVQSLSITGPDLIVAGKPGFKPLADRYLEAKLDTIAVPGLTLALQLPNGRRLMSAQTDILGRISLADLVIPYVPSGSYCYIRPDIGRIIAPFYIFSMADLSIPRSSIAEQQVLFKIIRPIVRLQYRAAGVNNISLPRDFADPARIARFLTDSCSLQVEPSAADPDLLIDITCQASSYYHDETEETELKAEAQIQIQEKTGAFKRTKSEPLSYEKSYRRDASVPVGLFLWEVSSRLNKTVKSILESW